MAWTMSAMEYIPDISHLWESPSLIGPGTTLTPEILFTQFDVWMVNAAVPNSCFLKGAITDCYGFASLDCSSYVASIVGLLEQRDGPVSGFW